MNTTSIIQATESLITRINAEYAEFAKADKHSTEFHVRSSIYKHNYVIVIDDSHYLQIKNSRGNKFFVAKHSGGIFEAQGNSFFCTVRGSVLAEDFGYSTFVKKSGTIEFKSDVV